MSETTPLGVSVSGNPGDVAGSVKSFVPPAEMRKLKEEMYSDFLLAKQKADVPLDYPFAKWVRRSLETLENRRKHDIRTEWEMGRIGKAEHDVLEEFRLKMVEAIRKMDVSDLDQYGIQHLNPQALQMVQAGARVTEHVEQTPTYRPGVVKPHGPVPLTQQQQDQAGGAA